MLDLSCPNQYLIWWKSFGGFTKFYNYAVLRVDDFYWKESIVVWCTHD